MFALANLQIDHLEHFLDVFGSNGVDRREALGSLGTQVFTATDDESQVYVLLEWRDRESFEAFAQGPETAANLERGGVTEPPAFILLDAAARFDA
jgi:heme-degrading monooxygenase HmoA